MGQMEEPIACSLPLREAAKQAGEWTDLHSQTVASEPIDGGHVVEYPIELADQVEDLVAREAACCAWLSLSTSRKPRTIRLELHSDNPDAGPVIKALIGV